MAKLANLVHVANTAKTDAQKNAVGEEVKKLLRGKKACSPTQELFSNKGIKIEEGKNLRMLGKGAYGAVFYGCLEDACKTQIAIKVTTEPSAKMEYRIAEKLRGMGVPRMYHFKSCNDTDILYFEYIKGETLQQWMKRGQTARAYRSLISQLIKNLKKIHEKYPKFRHHDLHWNNILVLEGNKPMIIDFGLSMIDGVRNPDVASGEFKSDGIYVGSHHMYDVHYILNIIYRHTKLSKVKNFIRDVFPVKYLNSTNPWIKLGRLRAGFSHDLPTYDEILEHSFFRPGILRKIVPKKRVVVPKKVVAPHQKVGTASAIRRARAVLQKEVEKKKVPPKRPGVAVVVTKPKVFINKNGDVKIDTKKCRLYKKEDLVKMFKVDPKLTKEHMCTFIKNM